jgi:hypothetical protein
MDSIGLAFDCHVDIIVDDEWDTKALAQSRKHLGLLQKRIVIQVFFPQLNAVAPPRSAASTCSAKVCF